MMIHDQIQPTHCAIPPTNPTIGGVPENFRANLSNNLATFEWDQPIVIPLGMQYRLLSAPFSVSLPTSMTLVYEGLATAKMVQFFTSSPVWYWVGTRTGSYLSQLAPGSHGLGLAPIIPAPPSSTALWSASVAPSNVSKTGSTSNFTTPSVSVTINNGTSPVFSWHNPTSMSAIINAPSGATTTFTTSGIAVGSYRSGVMWCRVQDGANVASLSVGVLFARPDYS